MPAIYPGAIRSFTTKVNNVDIIDAAHPNVLQEEVVAIQSTLGTNPNISTTPSGTFIATTTTFATVGARLDNIEKGIVGDVHTQYVKVAGGSTITASGIAVKPLVIKGAAGQTANLQEWQNSAGTVVASIDANGIFNDSGATQEHDHMYVLFYLFG